MINLFFYTVLIFFSVLFFTLFIKERQNKNNQTKDFEAELFYVKDDTSMKISELSRKLTLKMKELDDLEQLRKNETEELSNNYVSKIQTLQENHKSEIRELEEEFKEKSISKEFIEASLEKVSDLLLENYNNLKTDISRSENRLQTMKALIDLFNDEVEMIEKGVYQPKYNFLNSIRYEQELKSIRDHQKLLMSEGLATIVGASWEVNNSKREGEKMTQKYIRMILRSFNSECDVQISKVTYRNIKTTTQRINSIFEQLNKLYKMTGVELQKDYLNLKFDEMHLAFEYANRKQEEKEQMKYEKFLERERKREERIINEEIKEEKRKIDQEMKHYKGLLKNLTKKLSITDSVIDSENIYNKIEEVESKIQEKKEAKEELDFRESHLSAGYVYIISNIGAFGKDVIKIGVTRRLEPLDRIKELSSASVPFTFDVHALVFSYNAYELESELHDYFDKYRINKVNARKEFFNISIDEIEEKLKDYGELTINFKREAEATEYYQSKENIA